MSLYVLVITCSCGNKFTARSSIIAKDLDIAVCSKCYEVDAETAEATG